MKTMIAKIALKNIGRNTHRSLVVILAVSIGTLAGIFFNAWMQGMIAQKVEDGIYTEVGHLQLVNPQHLISESLNDTLQGTAKINAFLQQQTEIQAWSHHLKVSTMATTTRGTAAVTLVGINPEQEKKTSNLYQKIIHGNYFSTPHQLPHVVIGEKLAENLRIKRFRITSKSIEKLKEQGLLSEEALKLKPLLKKRFVTAKKLEQALHRTLGVETTKTYWSRFKKATQYFGKQAKITFTSTNVKGELVYITARVSGIYKTSNNAFDSNTVFMRQHHLAPHLGLSKTRCHTLNVIAKKEIQPDDITHLEALKTRIQHHFPKLKVQDIEETAPEVYSMQQMSKPSTLLILSIIYIALAFGITNTMTMAILERNKELGMLRAIGMGKKQIVAMIQLETLFLTSIGTLIGSLLALIAVGITGHYGINIFGSGFEDFGISAIIYPQIGINDFVLLALLVFFISLIASLLPIRKTLKTPAIEAMRSA